MKAVRIHTPGGPEALKYEDVPEPTPGAGQAAVKLGACGVNYIDVYFRTGQYKAQLPLTIGLEGAGTVTAVGAGVTDVKVGDRVAWTGVPGSYAQVAVVPADRLVKLPDGLTFKDGAAAMLQGMTAHYLAVSTYPLKKGDVCLVHAAAGGVGLLLCQMAKMRGATVIGTVSTEEKAALAKEAGADHVILYTKTDFEAEVKRLTGGARRARDLRRRGGQHLRQGIQLPSAARPHGALRSGERAGAAARPADPERARLAVRDATEPQSPHRQPRGAAGTRRRRARLDPRRQAQASPRASVPAGRGRRGAPRPRGPPDDGEDPVDPGVAGAATPGPLPTARGPGVVDVLAPEPRGGGRAIRC